MRFDLQLNANVYTLMANCVCGVCVCPCFLVIPVKLHHEVAGGLWHSHFPAPVGSFSPELSAARYFLPVHDLMVHSEVHQLYWLFTGGVYINAASCREVLVLSRKLPFVTQ